MGVAPSPPAGHGGRKGAAEVPRVPISARVDCLVDSVRVAHGPPPTRAFDRRGRKTTADMYNWETSASSGTAAVAVESSDVVPSPCFRRRPNDRLRHARVCRQPRDRNMDALVGGNCAGGLSDVSSPLGWVLAACGLPVRLSWHRLTVASRVPLQDITADEVSKLVEFAD